MGPLRVPITSLGNQPIAFMMCLGGEVSQGVIVFCTNKRINTMTHRHSMVVSRLN